MTKYSNENKIKISYRYYKKINNLNKFNLKHPNGLKFLKEIGYIPFTFDLDKYNYERLQNEFKNKVFLKYIFLYI